jgi:large repetitive protein
MWRIRRLAILPVLALLITAMVATSTPANAGTLRDPGKHSCALDHNGPLRYAECDDQGESAASSRPKPPLLGDIESSDLHYAAGAPPVRVTPSLTVTSPTGTLTGATVRVSSGLAAGQDALAFVGQSGIAGGYNAATGVLTFTGTGTASAYARALRSVTYADASAAAGYGTRVISFQVSDGEPDNSLSNVASRTVLVTAKPPVAAGDKTTTGKNAPVTISVLAGDTDPAGLPLTIASVNTTGTKGTVIVNPGQTTVTYNPNGQFAGLAAGKTAADKFTYQATDGTQTSNTATVTVTITGSGTGPQSPTVVTHAYKAVGNTPLGVGTTPAGPAVTVSGTVLSGDTDPDPAATLSVTASTQPAHGAVTVNPDGTFTYLPGPGYTGADSFQVTIAGSNDAALTATETVTITVGTVVEYVDNSLAAAGNGEAGSPFNTLEEADNAAGPHSIIFLYQGSATYTGGVNMQWPGEDVWGQPHGLTVDGYTLVPPGGSPPAITNGGGGDGIDLAEGADVEGVNITGPSRYGIDAADVNDATVGATTPVTISGDDNDSIFIDGGDGTLNFGDTSVTDGSLGEVSVANRSGGTVTFGGPITASGAYLDSNAGAAIAFTGTLTLEYDGFTATGGGTVTATGAGSTLSSAGAGALVIDDNTTIGAAGLTFQSVSSTGSYSDGIDLDDTGSSGGLTVTGTGAPGSGGTIQTSQEAGIQLTSTDAPSLTDMVIQGNISGGISGFPVNGLTLNDCTVSQNGTKANYGDGLYIDAAGTADLTVSVTGSTFTDNYGGAFHLGTYDYPAGTDSVTFTDNTVNGTAAGTAGGDVGITANGNVTVCAAITGNSITGPGQGGAGIELDQNATATIELPGYPGAPGDAGAVASFLEGGNTISATPAAVATVSGSGGGFRGSAGC